MKIWNKQINFRSGREKKNDWNSKKKKKKKEEEKEEEMIFVLVIARHFLFFETLQRRCNGVAALFSFFSPSFLPFLFSFFLSCCCCCFSFFFLSFSLCVSHSHSQISFDFLSSFIIIIYLFFLRVLFSINLLFMNSSIPCRWWVPVSFLSFFLSFSIWFSTPLPV